MSPVNTSFVARTVYPWYESTVRGRKTLHYFKEYQDNQWRSADELSSIQSSKLRDLLAYCQTYVPYYRLRWKEAGLNWQDVRSIEDLRHFPLLTKEDIREHYDLLISEPMRGSTMRKTTGGSTGQPLSFEYTRESYERRMAVMLRGYGWAGWQLGVKRLDIWGTELGSVSLFRKWKTTAYDIAFRRRVLSCFNLSNDTMEQFVSQIEQYKPVVIVGYTSALEALAEWMTKNRHSAWKPASVITAAEMLSPRQRAVIQDNFGAEVFHTYGCREFMLIGAECDRHGGYHVSSDHLTVEITDDTGRPIAAGTGNIVITDLHNLGMPLVRYVNGDLASAFSRHEQCSCGRGLPMLRAVEGRRLDMLTTSDGRLIPGEFFPHLMKDFSSIRHFQVRQTREDHLNILLAQHYEMPSAEFTRLRDSVVKMAGPLTQVSFEFVEDIPLTPSGKRRVTVRDIPQENKTSQH